MRGKRQLAGLCAALAAVSLLVASGTASATSGRTTAARPLSTSGLKSHLGMHLNSAATDGRLRVIPGSTKSAAPLTATASTVGAGQLVGAVIATVGVTFTMPSFTCASNATNEWLLPGIWVYDSSNVLKEQVDVNFNCNDGTKLQVDVICVNGSACDGSLTPQPGDVIEAVLIETPSQTIGEILDRTQNTFASAFGSGATGDTQIFIGDAGPSQFGVSDVPTFSTMVFSTATVNGFYLGDWFPTQLNLKTHRAVQIKAGTVPTTKFTTTFLHNH